MQEFNSGKLKGSCCYLSGAMEFASDHGVGWRRQLIRMIEEAGLGIDFIDPTNKPGEDELKIGEDKHKQVELQEKGMYHELKKYVSAYRRYDLRFVDLSDFLIAVIDPKIHLCGTYDEIFTAERQHKPMFFICEGGLKKLPRWLFDVIDLDDDVKGTRCNVFETLDEVVDELIGIDMGLIPMTKEWVLIRNFIEQGRIKSQVSSN